MKISQMMCVGFVMASSLPVAGRAEDEPATGVPAPATQTTGIVPVPAASLPAPGRPRGTAPGKLTSAAPAASASATLRAAALPKPMAGDSSAGTDPNAAAGFLAEEKWGMAGYNNNEPIYTILITSHDPRIIRCTADLKGTYIENGEKFAVTDRQTTTVFPNTQVQVGNWSGMDQQSGAVYAVKCHAI